MHGHNIMVNSSRRCQLLLLYKVLLVAVNSQWFESRFLVKGGVSISVRDLSDLESQLQQLWNCTYKSQNQLILKLNIQLSPKILLLYVIHNNKSYK